MGLDTVGLYDLGDEFHNQIVEKTSWECRMVSKRDTEEENNHLTDLLIQLDRESKHIYYPVGVASDWFEPGIYREIYFEDIEMCLRRIVQTKKSIYEKAQRLLHHNTLLDNVDTLDDCTFCDYKIPLGCEGFIATTIVSEFGYGWSCSIIQIEDIPWIQKRPTTPIYSAAGTSLAALAHTKDFFSDYCERLADGCDTFGPL